ncbi:hypothetical protein B0H34DRAFT_831012 [Crassisporium funariophilum]|nr:hypothetical protein B0H34DRAFT_831012 [Crassisporium funariophilum]
MIRNVATGSSTRRNAALGHVLVSSPRHFSVNAFSTWLDTHHLHTSHATTSTSRDRNTLACSLWVPGNQRFSSTRFSRQQRTDGSEESKLPRFLRRQQAQLKPSTHPASHPDNGLKAKSTTAQPRTPITHRSRHYDPSTAVPKTEVRLLEPHVLSARLKKLCDAGKLDDAVYMLKNAPLDSQNTPVWNTLIWEGLKAKRYQLAYQLFVDMKRRGFSPTTRTFQTFFGGLSRIEDWTIHPKQLTNARSLYDAYQRHVASIKRHDPDDPELTTNPLSGYIRILGSAGQYQEIFDVYYAMDKEGPQAPNEFIFTAMFQAIAAAKDDVKEGGAKVAADARLLWTQMTKASKKAPGFSIDSYTIVAALNALSGGNDIDHEMAFQITSQYFGLIPNKTTSLPGTIPLQPESFAAILRLCNQTKRYATCSQFLQQVKRRPEAVGGVSILDRAHMEEILKANQALGEAGLAYHALETLEWMLRQEITGSNGPKIRPALSTYNLVMQACWRGADWNSATRTFDLMTGYHSHDFMDGAVTKAPRLDQRGAGRNLPPNAEFMSFMLRAALATRNRADMRQALRIVDYLGFEELVHKRGNVQNESNKIVRNRAFFASKLAAAIVDTVKFVLEEDGKFAKPADAKSWKALAKQAQSEPVTKVDKSAAPSKGKPSVKKERLPSKR